MALLVTGVVFMLDGFGISNIKVRQISKNLSDGVYQTHYQPSRDFLDSLNQYEKGTDVLIPAQELPAAIDDVYNFYLLEDPSDWVNQAVAQYYGFQSIAVTNGS